MSIALALMYVKVMEVSMSSEVRRCRYCLALVRKGHKFGTTYTHLRDVVMFSVYSDLDLTRADRGEYYWSSSFMTLWPGLDDGCSRITLEEKQVYDYRYGS